MAIFDEGTWTPTYKLDAKYFMEKCNFLRKIKEEIKFIELGGSSSFELSWLKEELNAQRKISSSIDLYEEED